MDDLSSDLGIVTSFFQMAKVRLREIIDLLRISGSWNLNPGLSHCRICVLNHYTKYVHAAWGSVY